MKRLFAILVVLTLVLSLFSGCGPANSQLPEDEGAESSESREVTDMAGRQVLIPNKVASAFSTGAAGTILLYTIDPDLLVGVNYDFIEEEKEYLVSGVEGLPAYGQGGGINLEALMAAAPDICISYGSLSEKEIDNANTMQEQTGIPFIVIDGSLGSAAKAYRFIGEVLNMQERCEELALYAESALSFAESLDIPAKDRISVYFGNGHESLETAPLGSPHAELFDLVDANNVAVVNEVENTAARIDISAEQIIGWDPEVIIINGEPTKDLSSRGAADKLISDKRYANVKAVATDRVYPIPKYPFGWFDRPPGVNRLIGIYWLASVLYPEAANVDINEETKSFYSSFYHLELNQNQVDSLLGRQ